MGYLTPGDYGKTIQADNLTQIIGSNNVILIDAEETAVEKAKSHLTQKYLVDQEFTPTSKWDKANTYHQNDRVYVDAPLFDSTLIYPQNSYVTYQVVGDASGKGVYYNAGPGSIAAGVFDPTKWTFLAYQYTIFYVHPVATPFNYLAVYAVGNTVYWNGKAYTCKIATTGLTQETALQYINYQSIPVGNVFPDDPINGVQYWGIGVPYSVTPNAQIYDTTKWLVGDNRSKLVVWAIVVMALYYIHARISPRNIPDLRVKDYDDAVKMLKQFAEGDTTANLPLKQPKQGARVRYGGNVKNVNTY